VKTTCTCLPPVPSRDPRNSDSCLKCGRVWVNAPGIVWDDQIHGFYDHVEAARVPDFQAFRHHATQREAAGRPRFGFSYLLRDNPVDGMEEAADGGNYSLFEKAKRERVGQGEAAEITYLYEAARHFALAHAALRNYQAGKRGSP
jgi:hypothetical protein